MKRSEINALMGRAIDLLHQHQVGCTLCVLDAGGVGSEGAGVRGDSALQARLGYFGSGRFDQVGPRGVYCATAITRSCGATTSTTVRTLQLRENLSEVDVRQPEQSAQIKNFELREPLAGDVRDREDAVGAEHMQLSPIFPFNQQNHTLAGAPAIEEETFKHAMS